MSVLVLALIVAALVLAVVHELHAQGRDLLGWAVILLAVAIAIPHFT